MKDLLSVIEQRNFKTFVLFYNTVYFTFMTLALILLVSPALIAAFTGLLVFVNPHIDQTVKEIFDPKFVSMTRDHVSVILATSSVVLIFLTNSSAAFSRMDIDSDESQSFRNAAYGFMLATILALLSLGIYFLYASGNIKFQNYMSNNIITLMLSFVSGTLFSFAYGMLSISLIYAGKLLSLLDKHRLQYERFSQLEGDKPENLIVSCVYWIVVWVFLGRFLLFIIQSLLSFNFMFVIFSLGMLLIAVNQYLIFEHGTMKIRMWNIFFVTILMITNFKFFF